MNSSEELGLPTDDFYEALLDDNPQDLYDNAPCGYLSTSPDGTIVKVNHTFLAWTGYDPHALVGRRRLADLLTAGGKIFYETHVAPMLRMQGRARELAMDIRCADDSRLPVVLNAVVRRDGAGNPMVVRVAMFDATERRAYEQELLAQRRRAEEAQRLAEESEARARQLARTLQASFIPPELPSILHLQLWSAYRPAGDGTEVGGDFYDVFEAGDGSWVIAVGDVCGKGAEAAVVTSLARHIIRAATYRRQRPDEVLRTLNDVLLRESPERFCTVCYLRVDARADETVVTSVCGGHLPPIVATAGESKDVGATGTALGIFREITVEPVQWTLPSDALLAVYTDGCTEARAADGEFFGEARLHATLRSLAGADATDPADVLCSTVLEYQHGMPRDDIALVIARPRP